MKGSVGLLSIAMRTIDFEATFYQLCPVLNQFSQLHLTLTWSIFCNQENIVWSTRNPFSSFRINYCFCQIPLQSVFEVAFYYQKQSAIAFYYQKQCHCILLSETVPYNKPLTNRACSGRTGEYWPSVVAVRPSRSVSKRLFFSSQPTVDFFIKTAFKFGTQTNITIVRL